MKSIISLTAFSLLLMAVFIMQPASVQAQDPLLEDTVAVEEVDESNWEVGWGISVNASQASYSENWSQGGSDSFNAVGSSSFNAAYSAELFGSSHAITLRYGQTRVEGGDFRKSDDVIRLRNQFRRKFDDERWGVVLNINADTQFDRGYDSAQEVLRSRFLAPAYVTQILGMSFTPDDIGFQAEAGFSMQQTIVRDTDLSTRYGLEEGETFRNQAGFSTVLSFNRDIFRDFSYSGYVETFSSFDTPIRRTDLNFVNELSGDINDYVSLNFEFTLRYNDDVDDDIQTRQILSVGFRYSLM